MSLPTSFSQKMSLNIFKINWIFFVATILFGRTNRISLSWFKLFSNFSLLFL